MWSHMAFTKMHCIQQPQKYFSGKPALYALVLLNNAIL